MSINLKSKITLRFSILSSILGMVLIAILLMGFLTFINIRSFTREDIRNKLSAMGGISALQVDPEKHKTLNILSDESSDNYKEIKKILQNIKSQTDDIRFIYTLRTNEKGEVYFVVDAETNINDMSHLGDVYDTSTKTQDRSFHKPYQVTVEPDFYTDKWGTWLTCYAPVVDKNGNLECVLGIDMSAKKIIDYENKYLMMIIIICFVMSLIAVFIGAFLSKKIAKPLLILSNDLNQIQKLNLNTDINIKSSINEILIMKDALDNVKKGLRSFKKYVPADLVTELISMNKEAVLGVEKRDASIFFSDIENFSTISELIKPEILAEKLGDYFSSMTKIIINNNGTVDKYIGDAIMAFWGAPKSIENHAFLSCKCALECQKHLIDLNLDLVNNKLPEMNTRIGLNSGEVIVGNIGYDERMNYTVIGDNVNIASRLEGLNKYYKTHIMIGENTYNIVKNDFVVRMIDVVKVKGKNNGIKIYELLGLNGEPEKDFMKFLAGYNSMIFYYLERNWDEAVKQLTDILKMYPDDPPALMYLERCMKFKASPPPENWSGVITMREK